MLNISKSEIIEMVPMSDAIVAMGQAFSDFKNGKFIVPDRISMEIDNKNATVLIMPAYRTKGKYFTTKVVTVFQNTIAGRSSIISSSVSGRVMIIFEITGKIILFSFGNISSL